MSSFSYRGASEEVIKAAHEKLVERMLKDRAFAAKAELYISHINRYDEDKDYEIPDEEFAKLEKFLDVVDTVHDEEEFKIAKQSFKEASKPKTKAEVTRAANKKRDEEKQRRKEYEEAMIAAETAKAQKQKKGKGKGAKKSK